MLHDLGFFALLHLSFHLFLVHKISEVFPFFFFSFPFLFFRVCDSTNDNEIKFLKLRW